jgi:hypothetical protein
MNKSVNMVRSLIRELARKAPMQIFTNGVEWRLQLEYFSYSTVLLAMPSLNIETAFTRRQMRG